MTSANLMSTPICSSYPESSYFSLRAQLWHSWEACYQWSTSEPSKKNPPLGAWSGELTVWCLVHTGTRHPVILWHYENWSEPMVLLTVNRISWVEKSVGFLSGIVSKEKIPSSAHNHGPELGVDNQHLALYRENNLSVSHLCKEGMRNVQI